MYRIEGSGGVTRNCWQLIIIPKYINRGHPKTSGTILSRHWRCNMRKARLSRLAKSSLWLVQGRVKHGTRGCTDTESQCKNSGASTGLQWTRVQSVQAGLLRIAVNIVLYCFYYCRLRTGFCHFAPLWWLARLCCRSVPGFSPKILLLLLEYILLT